MTTITLPDDRLQKAMEACIPALRRLSEFQLDPALAHRLTSMGERKEFLTPEEHAELMALVTFTQQRTLEKLQADVALQRLQATFPEFVEAL